MILTDEDIKAIYDNEKGRDYYDTVWAIEAAILEKLSSAEPVAWRYKMIPPGWTYSDKKPDRDFFGTAWDRMQVTPLFTHPPAPSAVEAKYNELLLAVSM